MNHHAGRPGNPGPRSSMVVRTGRSRVPVGLRSSSSSRRAGVVGAGQGQTQVSGNLLVTSSGLGTEVHRSRNTRAGCCVSCPSRVLTSTCEERGGRMLRGVEVSDVLSSRLRWERRSAWRSSASSAWPGSRTWPPAAAPEPRPPPSSPLRSSLELAVLKAGRVQDDTAPVAVESMSCGVQVRATGHLDGDGVGDLQAASWSRAWRSGSG